VIVKITPSKTDHRPQFLALEKHFNEFLGDWISTKKNWVVKDGQGKKIDENQGEFLRVCIDKSGKDVNRVCYESWDVDLYYNEDSEIWYECLDEEIVQKSIGESNEVIERLQKWIDNKEVYVQGNRNNYLYQFSSALCRYGVDMMQVMSYLNGKFPDYPFKELQSTVKGAYKANDFGTQEFTEKQKQSAPRTLKIEVPQDVTSFWSINDKGRVNIDPKQFLLFIETNGFGIYRRKQQDKNWEFVKVENMIVDVVTVMDIKRYILKYVDKHAPSAVYRELQMKNRYFENTFLNALPLINVEQIRDKSDLCYLFFEKYYYEITAKKAVKKSYIELNGRHIWRSQVCEHDLTKIVPFKEHDFNKFVFNCMGQDSDRYRSACSSLGYGIHTYKKKRLAKLVYACDEGYAELDGMAEGGTGKNLFLDCLKLVRSVQEIDGKDFDKRDKFKFQTVSSDTQIVSIDDYEGDIKELFTKVTGHFAIEKKGVDKSILDFSEAPKMFISSNSSPKGFSSSFQRRLHLLEFSDHYNLEHTPSDEFGDKDFFSVIGS